MLTDLYNNIKDSLFNMGNTVHATTHCHKISVSEELSSGLFIYKCNGCPQLWTLNTRIPYSRPLKMDWEHAFMIVDFHPNSNFAKLYSGKIPKWNSFQGKVFPDFIPVS